MVSQLDGAGPDGAGLDGAGQASPVMGGTVSGGTVSGGTVLSSTVLSSTGRGSHAAADGDRVMDILRLATAGSVDDGKSTLIGRLLYDSKAIFEDQLASVERTSKERGEEFTNLALLTDGLRAEREQGITIDVAYRYFATPRRKFIIADTPGHIQYTRNMVTGASTADLAIVLVDARNGLTEQSRRHAFLTTLLRVPHLVLAVNKMDLVDYESAAFDQIVEEFTAFGTKLEIGDLTFIPISALHGDNVVERSLNMPWYNGPSLLHHLEHVHIASDRNLIDVRFPVQYVIRPHQATDPALHDYRGYAGQVAGGILKPGDEVMHLPSGLTTTIRRIDTASGPVDEAFPPMSVTLLLEDDLDISRGDMICRPHNQPMVTQDVSAMVSWMADAPVLTPRSRLIVKHTTRTVKAVVRDISYRLDINSLHRDESADRLGLNEIGRVALRLTQPIFCDPYARNRMTGGLILIDEATSGTVGAAMITEAG
jgi:sulfate adenylyltransferase subunit 1